MPQWPRLAYIAVGAHDMLDTPVLLFPTWRCILIVLTVQWPVLCSQCMPTTWYYIWCHIIVCYVRMRSWLIMYYASYAPFLTTHALCILTVQWAVILCARHSTIYGHFHIPFLSEFHKQACTHARTHAHTYIYICVSLSLFISYSASSYSTLWLAREAWCCGEVWSAAVVAGEGSRPWDVQTSVCHKEWS